MNADELRVDIRARGHLFSRAYDGAGTGVTSYTLDTVWIYKADDPYALHVMFFHGDNVTTWPLSRESLTDAVSTIAHGVGLGDTRLANFGLPWGDLTVLTLTSPSGTLDLTFDTYDLVQLLAGTEAIVPFGAEAARVGESLEHELFGLQP